MAIPPDEESVRIALASAGLIMNEADLTDLTQAYAGFREMAERICAVREADGEWADVGFRLGR